MLNFSPFSPVQLKSSASKPSLHYRITKLTYNIQVFSNTVVGSTLEEAVDDDEGSQRAQVKYEVIGTMTDIENDKPACVAEVVKVNIFIRLATILVTDCC